MATRNSNGIKFCEQFLKRNSKGTFQIGPAVWEENEIEIVDNARHTPDDPKSFPSARCAQVS